MGDKYQAQILLTGKIHDLGELSVSLGETFPSKKTQIRLIYQSNRTGRSIIEVTNDPEPRRNI